MPLSQNGRIDQVLRKGRSNLDTAIESESPFQPVTQRPRHVHIITDRFSMANTYLINEERLIVVDPGSVLNAQLLLFYLQRFLHRKPQDIDLIVLTHLHPDHTSGADELRKSTGAPIAACNVAQHIAREAAADKGADRGVDRGRIGGAAVSQFVGQMFSQARLSSVLHHLDLFAPAYERQSQLVDIWLEDVS